MGGRMSTTGRTDYTGLIGASAKREERALRQIAALQTRIATSKAAGPLARAVRAVFSTLFIVDSHARRQHKLAGKLSRAEAQLVDVREERRRLEAAVVADDLLSEHTFMPSEAVGTKQNTWSIQPEQSFASTELGKARGLSMNTWADRNTRNGAGA
jgi:hypothetical protein